MRVLTVRQPWALHIIQSGKDVESRSRNVAGSYRGLVAIHAALKADEDALRRLPRRAPNGVPRIFRYGMIIGVADLVEVHRDYTEPGDGLRNFAGEWINTCSPWGEPGVFHLVFANPRRLPEPIPFKGALGLRKLDEGTIAQIAAQLERTTP